MRFFDAEAVEALGPSAAAASITAALEGGLDPGADVPRWPVSLRHGQLLVMPSQSTSVAGVKLVTVAPGNSARGLPRVHGVYLLFDADTLAPTAALDGTALTTLRTPAVSVAAVHPRIPHRPIRLVVVGAGPQATGHAAAFAAVRDLADLAYLVRTPTASGRPQLRLGTPEAEVALAGADVIVCATTARSPVFDSRAVRDEAIVVAVGSHEPDAREVDGALIARATVLVEDPATALREAGDVVLAIAEGSLQPQRLVSMRDVVLGAAALPPDRPLVFKSVGMAWEDLVVADAVARLHAG